MEQTREDLRWARHVTREEGYYLACLLAQQVAEKDLKVFLYAQGEEIVLGHSVQRLCAAAACYQAEFADRARRWNLLDNYYIPTCYPSGLPDRILAEVYSEPAAEEAIRLAEQVVMFVVGQLKGG